MSSRSYGSSRNIAPSDISSTVLLSLKPGQIEALSQLLLRLACDKTPYLTSDSPNGPLRIASELRRAVSDALTDKGRRLYARDEGVGAVFDSEELVRHLKTSVHRGFDYGGSIRAAREKASQIDIGHWLKAPEIGDRQTITHFLEMVTSHLEDLKTDYAATRDGFEAHRAVLGEESLEDVYQRTLSAELGRSMIEAHVPHLIMEVVLGLKRRIRELSAMSLSSQQSAGIGLKESFASFLSQIQDIMDPDESQLVKQPRLGPEDRSSNTDDLARLREIVSMVRKMQPHEWAGHEGVQTGKILRAVSDILSSDANPIEVGEVPKRDLKKLIKEVQTMNNGALTWAAKQWQISQGPLKARSELSTVVKLLKSIPSERLQKLETDLEDLAGLAKAIDATPSESLAGVALQYLSRPVTRKTRHDRDGTRTRSASLPRSTVEGDVLPDGSWLDRHVGMTVYVGPRDTTQTRSRGTEESRFDPRAGPRWLKRGRFTKAEKPKTATNPKGTRNSEMPATQPHHTMDFKPITLSKGKNTKEQRRDGVSLTDPTPSARENLAARIAALLSELREPVTIPERLDPQEKHPFPTETEDPDAFLMSSKGQGTTGDYSRSRQDISNPKRLSGKEWRHESKLVPGGVRLESFSQLVTDAESTLERTKQREIDVIIQRDSEIVAELKRLQREDQARKVEQDTAALLCDSALSHGTLSHRIELEQGLDEHRPRASSFTGRLPSEPSAAPDYWTEFTV